MILVGRYRSPFTRRVAISMQLLGIAYEHRPHTAWSNLAEVRAVNPVGRVPALVLDSGESLFDSSAILDYIDQLAGPQRALVPPREPERHQVLRVTACALGVLEKVVAALYEQTMHPAEKVHQPWIEHNESQARSGLQWLAALPQSPSLAGAGFTQADVTTIAMYDFTRIVNARLIPDGKYPRLDALATHCSDVHAFRDTRPVASVDQANPSLEKISS
ncbi:MAG TPA: glutathione S-transferase family protein [Burkholderiaceae bacterium]|nr:glutathione S-transferase family protein [Burkholderiaceae bacterium]